MFDAEEFQELPKFESWSRQTDSGVSIFPGSLVERALVR